MDTASTSGDSRSQPPDRRRMSDARRESNPDSPREGEVALLLDDHRRVVATGQPPERVRCRVTPSSGRYSRLGVCCRDSNLGWPLEVSLRLDGRRRVADGREDDGAVRDSNPPGAGGRNAPSRRPPTGGPDAGKPAVRGTFGSDEVSHHLDGIGIAGDRVSVPSAQLGPRRLSRRAQTDSNRRSPGSQPGVRSRLDHAPEADGVI